MGRIAYLEGGPQPRQTAPTPVKPAATHGRLQDSTQALLLHERRIPIENRREMQEAIQLFLQDVGAAQVWGELHFRSVRQVLYEVALNATTHGRSTEIILSSTRDAVQVFCPGDHFSLHDLMREEGRGGKLTVQRVREVAVGVLEVVHQASNEGSKWSVVSVLTNATYTPCGLAVDALGDDEYADFTEIVARLEGCDEIHIYPHDLWSLSDLLRFYRLVPLALADRRIAIHGIDPNDPYFGSGLKKFMPDAEFR